MKRIFFILLCFCFAAVCAHAQTPEESEDFNINYDEIKALVTQEGVYDAMAARFAVMDTTLTMEEVTLLYYGFAFQPGYKGSMDGMLNPAVELNKNGKYQQAWDKGIDYLKDNPVSLTALQEIIKAGASLKLPSEQVMPYVIRRNGLLDVIAYSGDGMSKETAFKVISVDDEYIFMRTVLKVSGIEGQALIGAWYDLITITGAKNFDGTEIYFDITLPFNQRNKKREIG